MPYHHFKIPCDESAMAEAEMNRFMAGKAVLSVEKHFVSVTLGAYWAYCVQVAPGGSTSPAEGQKGKGIDYREVLSPEAFALFAKLRDWRKQRAEKDGCPPFAVLSNEQLADIARGNIATLAELGSINGIGTARLEKYGTEILAALADHAKSHA